MILKLKSTCERMWIRATLLDHPAYSPDLAPMDFGVFPVVKSALKGYKIDSFLELSHAVLCPV